MIPIDEEHIDQSVLIIEDDPKLRKVLVHSIENLGISVSAMKENNESFDYARENHPSLLIVSLEEEINHLEQYKKLAQQDETDLVLLLTDRLDENTRSKLEPKEVIYKPFDTRYLCRRILDLIS